MSGVENEIPGLQDALNDAAVVYEGGIVGRQFVVVLPGFKARRAGVLFVTVNGMVGLMAQSVKSPEKTYPCFFPASCIVAPYTPGALAEAQAFQDALRADTIPLVAQAHEAVQKVILAAQAPAPGSLPN